MENVSIRERVRKYVSDMDISQKLIAVNMQTSESKVSLMLNGKRKMTIDDYINICKAIAVSPNKFLD